MKQIGTNALVLCMAATFMCTSCTSKKSKQAADTATTAPQPAAPAAAEKPAPTGEALTLAPSVAAEDLSSETLMLRFFIEKPRTAADLNLQGPVQSVRYLTYDVTKAGDTYYKQDLVKVESDWMYYDKSYQYTFTKDGKCSPKSVLNYDDTAVSYYKPSKEAKYTYTNGRLTQILRDTQGEDHWRVGFTYPSDTEVAYEEGFYEGGRQVKETLVNNIVRQTREEGGAEGDSWVYIHTYTYNAHKDVIKDINTETNTYIGAAEPPKTIKTVYTYQYTYDAHGNWIGKLVLKNGEAQNYITRTISYYK